MINNLRKKFLEVFVYLLFIPLITSSFAVELDKANISVQAMQADLDSSVFGDKVFLYEYENLKPAQSILPEKKTRDQHLLSAGLDKEIQKFDEFDRDLLWLRAKRFEHAKLRSIYPNINSQKLKALRLLMETP